MKPATILFAICFFSLVGSAQRKGMTFDGVTWQAMTPEAKLSFVQGYVVGYHAGAIDEAAVWLVRHVLQPSQLVKGQTNTESDPSTLMFGQLVDGVNACYSDFRNTKLTVENCIDWTVAGVNGKSDAERSLILEDARKVQAMIDKAH